MTETQPTFNRRNRLLLQAGSQFGFPFGICATLQGYAQNEQGPYRQAQEMFFNSPVRGNDLPFYVVGWDDIAKDEQKHDISDFMRVGHDVATKEKSFDQMLYETIRWAIGVDAQSHAISDTAKSLSLDEQQKFPALYFFELGSYRKDPCDIPHSTRSVVDRFSLGMKYPRLTNRESGIFTITVGEVANIREPVENYVTIVNAARRGDYNQEGASPLADSFFSHRMQDELYSRLADMFIAKVETKLLGGLEYEVQ